MNFNIVEGSSTDDYKIYEDFKNDYLYSDMTVLEIKNKYGISNGLKTKFVKNIKEEEGIFRRKSKNTRSGLYIKKSLGKFIVYKKNISNGKVILKNIGCFDNKIDAEKKIDDIIRGKDADSKEK